MRQNGFRYVEATYRWPVIMDRYGAFLEDFVADRGATGPDLRDGGVDLGAGGNGTP
jgi:hypothetical protein